jgi:hypothetical protein
MTGVIVTQQWEPIIVIHILFLLLLFLSLLFLLLLLFFGLAFAGLDTPPVVVALVQSRPAPKED